VEGRNGAAHYGVWIGIILLASKCESRGTLVKNDGTPHDSRSISLRIRCDWRTVESSIKRLLEIGWLKTKEVTSEIPRTVAENSRESRATHKGRNTVHGKERNTHKSARPNAVPCEIPLEAGAASQKSAAPARQDDPDPFRVETPPEDGAAVVQSAAPTREGPDLFREFCQYFFAAGRALNDRDVECALRVWLNYGEEIHEWCVADVKSKTTDGTWSDARHTPYPANYLKQTPWTRVGGQRLLPEAGRAAAVQSAAQKARAEAASAFARYKGEL